MKKFLLLMTMVCSLGFLASCSSSDDNNGGATPSSVWDTFKGGSYDVWGESLTTNDNDLGYSLVDMKVNVEKAGDNTAKVTITSKETDYDMTVTIPEATVTADNGYTLKGAGTFTITTNESGAETKATATTGKVTKDATATVKISADYKTVSAEFAVEGDTISFGNEEKPAMAKLMDTWSVSPTYYVNENGDVVDADDPSAITPMGAVQVIWNTNEGTNIDMGGNPMPTADVAAVAQAMANQQDLSTVLSSVAFTRGGRILARYRTSGNKGDDTKWQIAEDYASYKVQTDNLILVSLNNEKILANIKDGNEKATLAAILGIFEGGIPVHIRWSNDNTSAFFYVDKTFAKGLSKDETIKALVQNIKDEDLNGMGALVKSFCSQVPGLLENTTELEAGIVLDK